jgi:hypothetical protein
VGSQSGIESCLGRFTEVNHLVKRSMTQSSKRLVGKFGASLRGTQRKAKYPVLRLIVEAYPPMNGVLSLTLPSRPNPIREVRLRQGGILDLLRECCGAPTRPELNARQFRYQDSLMGNRNSLLD